MRLLGYAALIALVCSWAVAAPKAGKAPKPAPGQKQPPAPGPKQPAPPKVDPKLQAELDALDLKFHEASSQQASVSALKIAKQLYELQIKATGLDSPQVRDRKRRLAGAYEAAGDYATAEKLFIEILRAVELEKGLESKEVMDALNSVMTVYMRMQRYDLYEQYMIRLIAVSKKVDGEKSAAFAGHLGMYAMILGMKNEYAAQVRMQEEALKVHEAIAKSPNDFALAGPLQQLAMAYWFTSQHAKAMPIFDRMIKIVEGATGEMLIIRVSMLWGTASMFSFGGRKDLAAPLFQKAIAMTETELAKLEKNTPDDWQVQTLVGQLGMMYRFNGDYAKAETQLLKAIKIAEQKKQSSGMEMMLAELRRIQGRNKEALALYERASAELTKSMPSLKPVYNIMVAGVVSEMGDYKRAQQLLSEYRVYTEKQSGAKSTMYGYVTMELAKARMLGGNNNEAEKEFDLALDIAERDLQLAMRTGTDSDHAVYFVKNGFVLDTILNYNVTYAPKSGAAARLALTTLLRRKGRVLDAAAAALATIRSKLSADDKKLLDELAAARSQLATLMVTGSKATSGDADLFTKEVATLEDKIQRLEAQVSKKSAAYKAVTQTIELATIQKVIPKDARLVELVNYVPHDFKAPYSKIMQMVYPPRRYLAYVVATKGDPTLIDLGEAAPIDQAIEKFRKALSDPDNDGTADLGKQLYDLTMAKIIPKLGGATNVLLAPDGALNVVPFSALIDDKKEFLIKKYTFTYLTSGRDLLRLSIKTKSQGGGVLFADPKFDTSGDAVKGKSNTSRGRRSADIASMQWPQLPGTAAEADAVVKTFKGLTVYRGEAATEGTLKHVKGPKVLHLATHGFFLPDEPPPVDAAPTGGALPVMGVGGPMAGTATPQVENPLLRSGLAFAGANKLLSGDDDGLLTALEASGLDLWGTKLVVLSACETGVGKVTNGDGVYGLRRSLVIAGAESLVMSMWQVDDFATKELMAGFYKKLAAGKPRDAALRDTQLELLAKKNYAHPFYWAAFLPTGATTPLKD